MDQPNTTNEFNSSTLNEINHSSVNETLQNWAELGEPFQNFNEKITQRWINEGFTSEQTKEWLKTDNFKPSSSSFAYWLQNIVLIQSNDLEIYSEEKIIGLVSQYDIWIKDFLWCDGCQKRTNRDSFFFNNRENNIDLCSEDCQNKLIYEWIYQAQNYLDYWYPQDGVCLIDESKKRIDTPNNQGKKRNEITHLNLSNLDLTGTLDLSDFTNLEELDCYYNKINELILKDNINLREIYCFKNQLTAIILPPSSPLKELYCDYNELTNLDLSSCFSLESLRCHTNQLTSLTLPKSNRLSKIEVSDNYLTTLNYACLNPLTLKDLTIRNNDLKSIDIVVFSHLVNLTDLSIGNGDAWIKQGNQGNQFTGSFASFQGLTKLEHLYISNLPLQSDLQYLPTNLQNIECNGQIRKELEFYGCNLHLWQVYHPHLMKQANKATVNLNDYQLTIKKQTSHPFLQGEINQNSLNYSSQFNYSSFLVKDIHPFSFETKTDILSFKKTEYLPFNYRLEKNDKRLPLRLYNLKTNQVENNQDINNYLILSYCWGTDWEWWYQPYGQSYQTRLTKLGRKALNKVKATHRFLKEQYNLNTDYIWIDNFCINQVDRAEKEQEVKKQRNYYSNATATLIAIDAKIGTIDQNDREKFMINILIKITCSPWFSRAWTFQEGSLSKQTIFMFDDALVDGRSLVLWWGGANGAYNPKPCKFITPFGWSAGNQNSSLSLEKTEKTEYLNLGEALFSITHRNQTVLLDKVYAILGLLPYGEKINVEYNDKYKIKDLEGKLAELINQAYLYDSKEIITYWGKRNFSNWLLPIINEDGSFQIEGSLNYDDSVGKNYLRQIEQVTRQGVQLIGYYTIKDALLVIELDCIDRESNIRWPTTLQFILNLETKLIAIKQVEEEEIYYSDGKQPINLFIDMINFKVIEGETEIKEYLRSLESQQSVQFIEQSNVQFKEFEQNELLDESLVAQQQSVDNNQQSFQHGVESFQQQSVQLVEQVEQLEISQNNYL